MNRKSIVISILLPVVISISVYAESWQVMSIPPDWADGPYEIVFTFENSVLSLNTDTISTPGGSSCEVWSLLLSGKWAVAGTIDSTGNLIADPYAVFMSEGSGGYIKWSPDTPPGYIAPLMLGMSFNGDGAATYMDYLYEQPTGKTTTGTMVIWNYLGLRPLEDDNYTKVSHTFYASVPEPSGILALACGIIGIAGLIRKIRRSN